MHALNSLPTFLLACFIFTLPDSLKGVNGLSFSNEFQWSEDLSKFQGNLKGFYDAVDKGEAKTALEYFTDDPVPESIMPGETAKGKEEILALFQEKTKEATYEKEIRNVEIEWVEGNAKISVYGQVAKTSGDETNKITNKLPYAVYLWFKEQEKGWKIFKMEPIPEGVSAKRLLHTIPPRISAL